MCIKINDELPSKSKYYKVFAEIDGDLCWLMRNQNGAIVIANREGTTVESGWLKSTPLGFHVWKNKCDAELFSKTITDVFKAKCVIKKVKVKDYKESGLCMKSAKGDSPEEIMGNIIDDNKNVEYGQAFVYRKMKVVR